MHHCDAFHRNVTNCDGLEGGKSEDNQCIDCPGSAICRRGGEVGRFSIRLSGEGRSPEACFLNHWIPVFTSVVILSDSEESASEQQILHFVQDDRLCGVFFCWDSSMPDKLGPNGEN